VFKLGEPAGNRVLAETDRRRRVAAGAEHVAIVEAVISQPSTAQTAMMRSVEPRQGNETALRSRPRTS
jgi:hypothetical protein